MRGRSDSLVRCWFLSVADEVPLKGVVNPQEEWSTVFPKFLFPRRVYLCVCVCFKSQSSKRSVLL